MAMVARMLVNVEPPLNNNVVPPPLNSPEIGLVSPTMNADRCFASGSGIVTH